MTSVSVMASAVASSIGQRSVSRSAAGNALESLVKSVLRGQAAIGLLVERDHRPVLRQEARVSDPGNAPASMTRPDGHAAFRSSSAVWYPMLTYGISSSGRACSRRPPWREEIVIPGPRAGRVVGQLDDELSPHAGPEGDSRDAHEAERVGGAGARLDGTGAFEELPRETQVRPGSEALDIAQGDVHRPVRPGSGRQPEVDGEAGRLILDRAGIPALIRVDGTFGVAVAGSPLPGFGPG